MQFNEEQWAHLVSAHGNPERVPGSDEIVYVLVLEGNKPNPNWTWYETALDVAVQIFQPPPAATHIEFFIPAVQRHDDVHFATYLGKQANWGSEFSDSAEFYLDPNGNGSSWRAVPIMAHDAIHRLRNECDRHVGTPYGSAFRLFNYPFSVPPFRSLAWSLDDTPGADAHCAALTMRCLRRAFPELDIPQSSAWYGPSTAFLQLAQHARMVSYGKRLDEMATVKATPEQEEAVQAAETLLRSSDDAIKVLSDTEAKAGIALLTERVIRAGVAQDATAARNAQLNLARALLRDAHIRKESASTEGGVSIEK
jgi:hypothetical protein